MVAEWRQAKENTNAIIVRPSFGNNKVMLPATGNVIILHNSVYSTTFISI